jgi:hypothetical protein
VDFSAQRTNLNTAEIVVTSPTYIVEDANTVLLTSCLASAGPYLYIYGTSTGAGFFTQYLTRSIVPVPKIGNHNAVPDLSERILGGAASFKAKTFKPGVIVPLIVVSQKCSVVVRYPVLVRTMMTID